MRGAEYFMTPQADLKSSCVRAKILRHINDALTAAITVRDTEGATARSESRRDFFFFQMLAMNITHDWVIHWGRWQSESVGWDLVLSLPLYSTSAHLSLASLYWSTAVYVAVQCWTAAHRGPLSIWTTCPFSPHKGCTKWFRQKKKGGLRFTPPDWWQMSTNAHMCSIHPKRAHTQGPVRYPHDIPRLLFFLAYQKKKGSRSPWDKLPRGISTTVKDESAWSKANKHPITTAT